MVIEWDRSDATWLRTQLNQPTGQKLLKILKSSVPKIKALNKESAWISAVEKQGAENLLEIFFNLAEDKTPDLKEGVDIVDLTKEGD